MVPARGWAGCVVTQDALRTLTLMAPAAEHRPAAERGESHSPAAPGLLSGDPMGRWMC